MNRNEIDVAAHNRAAWDREVEKGNRWTLPVSSEQVAAAREGEWSVVLTPAKPVPREWFGALKRARVLCLASGGGQQAPILAAAGARVTVLDNSPRQLARDAEVAARDGLELALELGVMTDLSRFDDASFDLVFHPVSNGFIPDVLPVWREAARVLVAGGALLAGFVNPAVFLFDFEAEGDAQMNVRFKLPYSDLTSLSPAQLEQRRLAGEPLEFSHSLEQQIGGQLDVGLVITGMYEDGFPGKPIDAWMPSFIATRSVRAQGS